MHKASAILMADVHGREDQPVCRLDSYLDTLAIKLKFISDLQKENECPVLIAGDILDHWKASPYLLSWMLTMLPASVYAIPGQHDLPLHQMELIDKSGYMTLVYAGRINNLAGGPGEDLPEIRVFGIPFGEELRPCPDPSKSRMNIALIHQMVWKDEPWPGAPAEGNVRNVMRKLKGYDLIVSGDNHQTITTYMPRKESYDQILVNPGSLMRMDADQIEHKPTVFLYYADDHRIESVPVPIEPSHKVMTRSHIDIQKEKDARLEAFVKRLGDEIDIGLSFEMNVRKALDRKKIRDGVRKVIEQALEGREEI